ncbi:MAG: S1C family serine protease [Acidimicrobiales bacterium]
MSAIEEISAAVRRVAESIGPSVVSVNGQGGGIVVGPNLVATNAHNLRGDEVHVTFADGRSDTGSVAGADVDGDLAVIAVDTAGAPVVAWAEEAAELGQVVITVANPRGRGTRAVAGTVTSVARSFRGPRGRRISEGLEHTASLGRGCSGGPLLNVDAQVVGMNTRRMEDGFYLATSVTEDLRRRIDGLAAGKAPARRRLGAAIAPPQVARRLRSASGLPEVDGLLIRGVEEGGPAERSGLLRGDVLLTVGGQPLSSVDDLYRALDGEGGELEFTVARALDELTITVAFPGPTPAG